MQERLKDPGEELSKMVMLKLLFEGWGTLPLETDDIRSAFRSIVSEKGALGKP